VGEDGLASSCTTIVAALVDTNILVYRFDPRDEWKQQIATDLLRRGIEEESLRIPHQAIVEFYAVVTRSLIGYGALLSYEDAVREAEELLAQFVVLYPNEAVIRTALRGVGAYRMSWYDAHLWAYAETYGLPELISEDFQHGRLYGNVRVIDPFREITPAPTPSPLPSRPRRRR
jgi:predicted nucleic acid-binding protein